MIPTHRPIHHTAKVGGWLLLAAVAVIVPVALLAQTTRYALVSPDGLTLHNVKVEPATLQGKSGLRVTMSDDQRQPQVQTGATVEQLAVINDLEFGDGTITAEIAGDVQPGVAGGI